MKILKYLLGFIAFLAVIFFGNGILSPTISYENEILVDKPVEEAWAVMNDESKTKDWLPFIINMEHMGGEKGEVGAVTKYTFLENGQESEIVETIKAIRPNEHVAMDFVAEDVMTMDYQVNFTRKDNKTLIKSATIVEASGFFMRSLFSFMTGTMKAQEDKNFANLKKVIEENTTNYFPQPMVESVAEEEEEG